jgi:hypothetical protein
MRKTRVGLTLICFLFAMAAVAGAQSRKPGLWEMTTTMTWQKSPFPEGMMGPDGGANSPLSGVPRTVQVCLTQDQIDKYGGPVPQTRGGCQLINFVKTSDRVAGDMVCTGVMTGKGTFESSWDSEGRTKGKVHFVGAVQAGPNPKPVEWTSESTSAYKSPDCGSVKPWADRSAGRVHGASKE